MSAGNRDPKSLSFAYHAHAVGFAAALSKPSCETIPSQGVASLAATGGESYSTIRDYNWKGLISFSEASAYTTGSMDHGAYNTLSTVTVKDLNVANMVHAGLVVARVTSRHVPGDPEAHITFTGSTIRELAIAGREVDVVLDDDPFTRNPTYKGLADELGKLRRKDQCYRDDSAGLLSSSLAMKVGSQDGFKISIPEFGTVYVAQVIIRPSYRRISMLRFELGCPVRGALSVGDAVTNGVEYWP